VKKDFAFTDGFVDDLPVQLNYPHDCFPGTNGNPVINDHLHPKKSGHRRNDWCGTYLLFFNQQESFWISRFCPPISRIHPVRVGGYDQGDQIRKNRHQNSQVAINDHSDTAALFFSLSQVFLSAWRYHRMCAFAYTCIIFFDFEPMIGSHTRADCGRWHVPN